jgi:hypothetical protein
MGIKDVTAKLTTLAWVLKSGSRNASESFTNVGKLCLPEVTILKEILSIQMQGYSFLYNKSVLGPFRSK